MTDEQNDKRPPKLSSDERAKRNVQELTGAIMTDEQWQVTCAYCADRDDEIERLRAQLAIFTPSEIKAAHERRTATDV